MLFNSFDFIFVFLPLCLTGFVLAERYLSMGWAVTFLGIASLIFYGYWDIDYIGLILGSITANFLLSHRIARSVSSDRWLWLGIAANLGLLFVFKYTAFAISIANDVVDAALFIPHIVLPIGISFFTFQQIAFLVDVYRREVEPPVFTKYLLFVGFFPQLIAGPIVHHREMMPQFDGRRSEPLELRLTIGMTIFVIGLAKKMILADTFAGFANPLFNAVAEGEELSLFDAWAAAISYTFQIYFDFSGYSDMAIGLARMFGIVLPINFASPYKARSIIDFWRRWHITLSRFLRDYLYILLGGNRRGVIRTQFNVFVTMVLGGLWHGAAWTFVLWGIVHAAAIVVNHVWRNLGMRSLPHWLGWILTFLVVVVSWVFFRASSFTAAISIYESMIGMNGISLPRSLAFVLARYPDLVQNFHLAADGTVATAPAWLGITLIGGAICWFAPNTQTMLCAFEPALTSRGYSDSTQPERFMGIRAALAWRPNAIYAVFPGILFIICMAKLNDVSEFIYFKF